MKIFPEEKKVASLLAKALSEKAKSPEENVKAEEEKEFREALKTASFVKYGLEPPELSSLFSQKLKRRLIAETSRHYGKKRFLQRFGLREFSFNYSMSFKTATVVSVTILCVVFVLLIMKGNEKSKRLSFYHQLYQEVIMKDDIDSLYKRINHYYVETIYQSEELREVDSFWNRMIRQTEYQTLEDQGFSLDIHGKRMTPNNIKISESLTRHQIHT